MEGSATGPQTILFLHDTGDNPEEKEREMKDHNR